MAGFARRTNGQQRRILGLFAQLDLSAVRQVETGVYVVRSAMLISVSNFAGAERLCAWVRAYGAALAS